MQRQVVYLLMILVLAAGCTSEAERKQMRSGLDSLNTRNRNDQPFTVQDVEPYVRFFDDHGTADDRLLAHYLLGRAYYDHGEAPMALQCYHDAIDCADTTLQDFDYAQLSRVYGQMGDVFYDQGLYQEALAQFDKSVALAWKDKDILLALRNYEQKSFAYLESKDTTSAIAVIEDVANKYSEWGKPVDAAISLAVSIRPLIDKGDYIKAKRYMDKYEALSGRFDSYGNIEAGREIYYKSKGLYYLYTNKLDSAEYYFRKELRDGRDYSNQNAAAKGLSELYQRLHQPDSIAKYSLYAYVMSDSLYSRKNTKEVERMQAMYDYTRHQEIAKQESIRAALANRKLLICSVVLLAVLLLATWLYIARKKLIENLRETALELAQIRMENHDLRHDATANQQKLTENAIRIKQLEKKLGRYGKLIYFGVENSENALASSPNYLLIKEKAIKGQLLTDADWTIVRNVVGEYLPGFYDFIISHWGLDSTEYRICILLRLHFKASEIANMLSVTPPYISKASTDILANLYGEKGSSKDLSKQLNQIS